MPKNPAFELFEVLCTELAGRDGSQIIDENNLSDNALIDDLMHSLRETSAARAFQRGVEAIIAHFDEKRSEAAIRSELANPRVHSG